MLHANSITKDYSTPRGPLPVLRGISLSLEKGQSVVIMGPSGCGKSTFLNILGTLESPTSGSLTLDGHDPFVLAEADLARFRNRRIGFIFQDHHLLPHCSVLENVLIPTLAEDRGEDRIARARMLLDRVGLTDRSDHRPAELSGGERQRVAVARAMINRPELVLADEPTGNLDRATAEAVSKLMLELHQAENSILIVVTHNPALTQKFDSRWELNDGTLAVCDD